jgi:hypothetical protein
MRNVKLFELCLSLVRCAVLELECYVALKVSAHGFDHSSFGRELDK